MGGSVRVGVFGAGGRMGRTICQAVAAADDLELVAAIDPQHAGERVAGDLEIAGRADTLLDAGATVAIDFTVAEAAVGNLGFCLGHGLHVVCGTTGIGPTELDALAARFNEPAAPNCVLAPNFAISAVLLLHLAAVAAPFFESIEVIELHHENKRDAPSGTAMATALGIEAARAAAGAGPLAADPTEVHALEGARGGRTEGGVQVHSVRLTGLVAHEEVLFGTTGQSLTIRQDSYDRNSFMPGVLLATRRVAATPGFTFGLEVLLGL